MVRQEPGGVFRVHIVVPAFFQHPLADLGSPGIQMFQGGDPAPAVYLPGSAEDFFLAVGPLEKIPDAEQGKFVAPGQEPDVFRHIFLFLEVEEFQQGQGEFNDFRLIRLLEQPVGKPDKGFRVQGFPLSIHRLLEGQHKGIHQMVFSLSKEGFQPLDSLVICSGQDLPKDFLEFRVFFFPLVQPGKVPFHEAVTVIKPLGRTFRFHGLAEGKLPGQAAPFIQGIIQPLEDGRLGKIKILHRFSFYR